MYPGCHNFLNVDHSEIEIFDVTYGHGGQRNLVHNVRMSGVNFLEKQVCAGDLKANDEGYVQTIEQCRESLHG